MITEKDPHDRRDVLGHPIQVAHKEWGVICYDFKGYRPDVGDIITVMPSSRLREGGKGWPAEIVEYVRYGRAGKSRRSPQGYIYRLKGAAERAEKARAEELAKFRAQKTASVAATNTRREEYLAAIAQAGVAEDEITAEYLRQGGDHKTAKNGIAYVKRYELLAAIVAQRSEV